MLTAETDPITQDANRIGVAPAEWYAYTIAVGRRDPSYQAPLGLSGLRLDAYVNHGRWVCNCPTPGCGNAQLVSMSDQRFYCAECRNHPWRGAAHEVRVPADRADVERVLSVRPAMKQNWLPHETVADLEQENADWREEILAASVPPPPPGAEDRDTPEPPREPSRATRHLYSYQGGAGEVQPHDPERYLRG